VKKSVGNNVKEALHNIPLLFMLLPTLFFTRDWYSQDKGYNLVAADHAGREQQGILRSWQRFFLRTAGSMSGETVM
jgi:hypothetical protein